MKLKHLFETIIFAIFLYIPLVAESQNIKGGVIIGLNASQVDGDEVYGFHKYGLNAGALAILPINKFFSISIETLYNQKGSYQRVQSNDSLNGAYKLRLNYLDVPVLFRYEDKGGFNFGTGFSWGRLVEFSEWEHGRKVAWQTLRGPYKSSDVDWIFDVRFRVLGNTMFNFRYAYSVAKIRTRTFLTGEVRKQFNNVLSCRIVYIFNDKQLAERKKSKEKL